MNEEEIEKFKKDIENLLPKKTKNIVLFCLQEKISKEDRMNLNIEMLSNFSNMETVEILKDTIIRIEK